MRDNKTNVISVRLTNKDVEYLRELSDYFDCSTADVVRKMIHKTVAYLRTHPDNNNIDWGETARLLEIPDKQ